MYEVWGKLVMGGSTFDGLDEVVKPETAAYLERLWTVHDVQSLTLDEALIERRRLRRLWSASLTDYTVAIGPTGLTYHGLLIVTLTPTEVELLKKAGLSLRLECFGLPSVALPMGVSDGCQPVFGLFRSLLGRLVFDGRRDYRVETKGLTR